MQVTKIIMINQLLHYLQQNKPTILLYCWYSMTYRSTLAVYKIIWLKKCVHASLIITNLVLRTAWECQTSVVWRAHGRTWCVYMGWWAPLKPLHRSLRARTLLIQFFACMFINEILTVYICNHLPQVCLGHLIIYMYHCKMYTVKITWVVTPVSCELLSTTNRIHRHTTIHHHWGTKSWHRQEAG